MRSQTRVVIACTWAALAAAGCETGADGARRSSSPSSAVAPAKGGASLAPKSAVSTKDSARRTREGRLPAPPPLVDLSHAVGVSGPVKQRIVDWEPGLKLAEAIVAADYLGDGDPREIVVHRQGQAYFVNVRKLMRGLENPAMEAGDVIEIRP